MENAYNHFLGEKRYIARNVLQFNKILSIIRDRMQIECSLCNLSRSGWIFVSSEALTFQTNQFRSHVQIGKYCEACVNLGLSVNFPNFASIKKQQQKIFWPDIFIDFEIIP